MPAIAAAAHGARRAARVRREPLRRVGAQREPGEQRHGEHRAHGDQQLEAHAALVQRLAEQPLAGEQDGGAGDEQHAEALAPPFS